ncbi:MAG: DNA alkylation repair protein [Thermodesulfobacteriota bacterium]
MNKPQPILEEIRGVLKELGSRERAVFLQRFFKTGPGEYGEGDIFLGIRVPDVRRIAKRYRDVSLGEIKGLLTSPIHEERLLALLILVGQFSRGSGVERKSIYDLYLSHTHYVNSWDLVDLSAEKIVGAFLMERKREPLYTLSRSRSLWERRIAIMSTFHFIKRNDFSDTVKIAAMLLRDEEVLIQKAVGWMLREVGKRHLPMEEAFLKSHYREMARTTLRYAIEQFPAVKRERYLKGELELVS